MMPNPHPLPTLDDETFERFTDDVSLIMDEVTCAAMIRETQEDLDQIHIQITAYEADVSVHGVEAISAAKRLWFTRACKARVAKSIIMKRLQQRMKQIAGTTGPAQRSKKDPAVGLAKQARLHEQAAALKESKRVEALRLQSLIQQASSAKKFSRRFVGIARRVLAPELFAEIEREALEDG